MKLIITENKMYDTFARFMETRYNLSYNNRTREFIDNDNQVFGWMSLYTFFYSDLPTESFLKSFFGKNTDKMLLKYLKEMFPDVSIHHIE